MKAGLRQIFYFSLLTFLSAGISKATLSGGYTINAGAPASATNYQNFASAVSDLNSGTRSDAGPVQGPGVSGPVVFTVSAGSYNERLTLFAVTGASATNTITFDGVDPATRTLTWTSNSVQDYTWRLDGADHIRIQNLNIANPGTTYGFGIQLINNAIDNEITGCKISLPSNSSGTYKVGIIGATTYTTNGLFVTDLKIANNEIDGGRYGVVVNGPTNTQSGGLVIDSNMFVNQYYSAIRMEDQNLPQITANEITMGSVYISSRGMELYNCSRYTIASNKIMEPGLYGIYLSNTNFNTTDEARVYNNFIGGGYKTTGTAYGMYLTTAKHVKVVNNSFLIDNPGSGCRGFYLTGNSNSNDFINNSISASSAGSANYVYYIINLSYVGTITNNNLYSTTEGSIFAYLQGSYNSLATLQAGVTTQNQNTTNNYPNYFGQLDLHTFGPPLNNLGTNVTWMTEDIDGQSRPLAPDVIMDIGADEHVLPPFDADIWDILSPLVVSVGANTVTVQIQNNGINSLNGTPMTLQYSTDGGATWPVTESFTPTALATSGGQESFTFTTPWVVATPGTYNFCARINPQVTGDPDPTDQMCLSVCTGMSGAYTINSASPTAGTNYNSFSDCASALNACGIGGPVTVTVAPGTYTDQFWLGEVLGASATNTITIDGGDTSLVTLQQNFSSSANSQIVKFDGTDYTTFKNITVKATGNYGTGVYLTNTADYNTIDSLSIWAPTQLLSSLNIGLSMAGTASVSSYGNSGNYNTISNNVIIGGYYGMRINGISSTSYVDGNKIIGNEVKSFYFYGIMNYYQQHMELENNYVHTDVNSASTSSSGIYSYYPHGDFRIVGNRVHTVGRYGLYVGYANRYNSGTGLISNNMAGADFFGTSAAYGMYMISPYDVDITNNSLSLGGYAGYALYMSISTSIADSIRLFNNILSAGGNYPGQGGQALYISNTSPIQYIDHNNYYTNGATLATYGAGFLMSDLTQWQLTFPGINQNSVSVSPGFISLIDLHIICSAADDLGTPTPLAPTDFDAQARSATTPDIGADEFNGIVISMDLGPDSIHCDPLFIYGDTNAYVGFSWGGGQSTPGLYVDSTDVYHLTVTDSNNCQASDSVMVTVLDLPYRPYINDTIGQCSYDSLDAQNPGSSYLWNTSDTTQIMYPPSSGVYTVEITSPDGCVNNDTVTVTFFADAVANLGADTTFCLGQGYLLDAGNGPTGTSYTWNSGSTTQQVLVTAPGIYSVTVSTPQGCTAIDSVTMNALLAPVVNLGSDRTECDSWVLDAGNQGVSYNWSTGATTQTISGTQAGTYSVTVTNANGCPATDQVILGVGSTPVVNLGTPPTLCQGQTVSLNAGNPGFNYLWSNGQTTQSINVGSAGTYIVDVTDPATNCTGSDTVTVIQSFLNVNIGPDFTLCDGSTVVLNAGSGPTGYLWNNGATTQTITITTAGTYSVQVTDALGCNATDDVVVAPGTVPTVAFTSSGTAPLFQTAQFTDNSGANVTSWFWDFGDGSTSTQQNPTHQFVAMGTFSVCLTVSDGTCENTTCNSFVVSAPVEIEDEIFSEGVTVFPNPNNGEFAIDFDLPKAMNLTMDIVNITGQNVMHRDLSGVLVHREPVDISRFSAGMYFLRVVSDKGNEMVRKIIVQ